MVCFRLGSQEIDKSNNQLKTHSKALGRVPIDNFVQNSSEGTDYYGTILNMEFEEHDKLSLQYLAGVNLIEHPPLYAPGGEFLFIRSNDVVQVYSTITGVLARQLTGASSKLVSMELELRDEETLVACTSNGEVLRWSWRNGRLQHKLDLHFLQNRKVLTFNLINFYGNSNTSCALVIIRNGRNEVKWIVMDSSNAQRLNVPLAMRLMNQDPLVAVNTKHLQYLTIVQGCFVYFVNYKSWTFKRLFNAYHIPITVVRMHPVEVAVITGDETGKIFIWREFMDQATVKTTMFHWHHTTVTSISFSPTGTSFYSSGHEAVLVFWNIKRPDVRHFLPRVGSVIRQICTNEDNSQIAICTADNGVHFIGTDKKVNSTLQEFTFIEDDKTGDSKFPVGLRMNPRTNTLVLNGKHGHLQFYSVYTKTMLYNMDIVMQNRLSMETDKILYNIRVTKSAFNIDWMATGEVFDDKEHLPELRLKFWKYDEAAKIYELNTNIELPHEGGFKAIEFSSSNQVDNLMCATVGKDNVIKIWSLEESDNIYKKGKIWYCIARTNSYRDLCIESISFSQDGSVLAAGCGNILCIYRSDNLKLKAALTPPAGFDGVVPIIEVNLHKKGKDSPLKEEFTPEKRKKWMELFNNFIEKDDETLIKEIDKFAEKCEKIDFQPEEVTSEDIDGEIKEKLYKKIMDMHQLNFYHKVLLFQRLGIRLNVHPQGRERVLAYLYDTIMPEGQRERLHEMQQQVKNISVRERYKAKYRLYEYEKCLNQYEAEVQEKLIPIMEVLNFGDSKDDLPHLSDSESHRNSAWPSATSSTSASASTSKTITADERNLAAESNPLEIRAWLNSVTAQISKVQFAAGEWAHLVIVCTERRVLIYNLLTLRVHAVCKLSVKHLAFDPISNLVAAFTKYNELYVFQPNVPLPIYQRPNLPRLYGAVWLPRRHPKNRSINVDWQSQSTLYFLTEQQQIFYLGVPDSVDDDAPPPIIFSNPANQAVQYSTFGTFATQQHSDMQSNTQKPIGPLVIGNSRKMAVQSIINMSTHTMPPLSLLAADFVKSLLKTSNSAAKVEKEGEETEKQQKTTKSKYSRTRMLNGGAAFMNGNGHCSEDDDESDDDDDNEDDNEVEENSKKFDTTIDNDVEMVDEDLALKRRKKLLVKREELSKNAIKTAAAQKQTDIEVQAKCIAESSFDIEF